MNKIFALVLLAVFAGVANAETRYVSVTPVVDTSAYAAKDVVGGASAALGSGILTFAVPKCGPTRVSSVILTDKSDNATEYDIVLFKSLPTGTITDQSGFAPADASLTKMLPVINLATTDHFSFTDNGVSSLSSLNSSVFSVTSSSSGNVLYAVIVSRGTPTYATSGDVTLTLGFECTK